MFYRLPDSIGGGIPHHLWDHCGFLGIAGFHGLPNDRRKRIEHAEPILDSRVS
jgi:hypothetical protein